MPVGTPSTAPDLTNRREEVPLQDAAPRQPMRTCVGCRASRPKRELVRVAMTPSGVRVDRAGHLPGRGAYLCPDPTCLHAAAARGAGALRRALRGGSEPEAPTALEALRTEVLHHQVHHAP